MTNSSYHHGSLHQAILDAAVAEARCNGPHGVQIRGLAKTVGVSASAVYRHVASIDVLLAEVAQVAREQLATRLIDMRDRAPSRRTRVARSQERFRAIGRGYVNFALTEPHLFDTAFTPTSVQSPRPDEPSAWQVLVDGVQELVDVGLVPPAAGEQAALIAWAGVHGIASILVRRALGTPVEDDVATDVVLDGIMRSLETL